MIIGVAKEKIENEKRVALVPESVKRLRDAGFDIYVEKEAGTSAGYIDREYEDAGSTIVSNYSDLIAKADIVLKVRYPIEVDGKHEAEDLKPGAFLFGIQDPLNQDKNLEIFKQKKLNVFAMEFIPRITLAQSMDVLSSMATIAGYKSVLLATNEFGKFMPMLMTAAGTLPPAKVLILGAGVAGLQAIATARRLGAIVEVFDTRHEVKEQVESVGAKFVEMELEEDASDDQGYAKEASTEFIKKEMELINKHLSKSDICITTAQVFGKKAPVLIKGDMVENMRPGSVIVDMAVEQGGNCELSRAGETVVHKGVKIIGQTNIPGLMPDHASKMYSKNIENLLLYLYKDEKLNLDSEDEIVARTLITRDGEMVSELIKSFKN